MWILYKIILKNRDQEKKELSLNDLEVGQDKISTDTIYRELDFQEAGILVIDVIGQNGDTSKSRIVSVSAIVVKTEL